MNSIAIISALLLLSGVAVGQRLPEIAFPTNYQLTLTPDLNKDKFAGNETIQVRVLKPTSTITLNALDINFEEASITAAGKEQPAKVAFDKDKEIATLTMTNQLPAGIASIHIVYSGTLNEQSRGFFLSKAGDRKYAVTQFEATDARRAFPSFDEPAYKATFDITAVVDKGDVAISNSPVISDTAGPGEGKHTVKFATTPKMSSYLVALVVGNFESIGGSADGIAIRLWAPPGKKEMGTFAMTVAEQCMKYYNQYFGIKYPFKKLDLIAVPDFFGAMENTAAITFRDSLLLLDEKQASVSAKKAIAATIAHEMSHQWFGDLVTMGWWDDIWLNEGFATWMESKPIAEWQSQWNVNLDYVLGTGGALFIDSLQNTRPIYQKAETPAQIVELFDTIAYVKTAAVLRMLESYLGEQSFRSGVNAYLQAHAYGNATRSDFWKALADASGKPVDRIMQGFVDQPGAPMVSVTVQCNGDQTIVQLSQHRFYYDKSLLEAPSAALWQVPMSLKGAGVGDRRELLTRQQQRFSIAHCDPWVFGNANGDGYYRVRYDGKNLQRMASDAETKLSPAERVVLVRDVWNAVLAGQQPIADFLELVQTLAGEPNSAVVGQMKAGLIYIGDYLISGLDRDKYQAWVRNLLQPRFEQVGWQPAAGEDENRKALRAQVIDILGYIGRDTEVLKTARQLATKALEDSLAIDPSIADVVFLDAALEGDVDLYNRIMAHLKSAKTSPQQYHRYLLMLAQFSDRSLLQRTLDLALSPEVSSQDRLELIAEVMRNPAGRKLGWDFVESHWQDVSKTAVGFNAAVLVWPTWGFCDPQLRDQVRAFFTQHPVPEVERDLRQAQENAGYCIDLKTSQGPALGPWLAAHSGAPAARAAQSQF